MPYGLVALLLMQKHCCDTAPQLPSSPDPHKTPPKPGEQQQQEYGKYMARKRHQNNGCAVNKDGKSWTNCSRQQRLEKQGGVNSTRTSRRKHREIQPPEGDSKRRVMGNKMNGGRARAGRWRR